MSIKLRIAVSGAGEDDHVGRGKVGRGERYQNRG